MATLALLAEFSLMHVIIFVATGTCTRHHKAAVDLFLMASVAVQFLVPAIELEFGTLVVIEIPCFP